MRNLATNLSNTRTKDAETSHWSYRRYYITTNADPSLDKWVRRAQDGPKLSLPRIPCAVIMPWLDVAH